MIELCGIFPDWPEAYELRHRIGLMVVIYTGAEYGPLLDVGEGSRVTSDAALVLVRELDEGFGLRGTYSVTAGHACREHSLAVDQSPATVPCVGDWRGMGVEMSSSRLERDAAGT